MINEHKKYLLSLEKYLNSIGFSLKKESEYTVVFENNDGWKVAVDAERYYSGVFRWMYSPNNNHPYSILLLIKIYEEEFGEKIILNSYDSWIKFIKDHHEWLFDESQPYKKRHDELDCNNAQPRQSL